MGMDWCVDCDHYLVCKYVDYDRWSCSRFRHYVNTEEVVRCKDCKHYADYGRVWDCQKYEGMNFPDEDDFCSYGERKDNDST